MLGRAHKARLLICDSERGKNEKDGESVEITGIIDGLQPTTPSPGLDFLLLTDSWAQQLQRPLLYFSMLKSKLSFGSLNKQTNKQKISVWGRKSGKAVFLT